MRKDRKAVPGASKNTTKTASQPTRSPSRAALQDISNSRGTKNTKRQTPDDDELEEPTQPAKKKAYLRLKPYTKQFTTDTISSDWRIMPQSAQDQMKAIIVRAKRMIVGRAGDLRKAAEVEQALDPLAKRLDRRLPRMPYPPRTKDVHFDMDKMLERTRKLEAQITPFIHTQQLLEASIQEEQERLQFDRSDLKQFRKRVKKEQRQVERTNVEFHPALVKRDDADDEPPDSADNIGLVSGPSTFEDIFDTQDPDIAPLVNQLSSHLASMKANLSQLRNLDDILIESSTQLGSTMQRPRNTD